MDITQADFWDVPNEQGLPTFSYDALLAQLILDLPFTPGSSPNIGLGGIATSGGHSINNLLITPMIMDFISLDDLGFFDVSSGNPRAERCIIPDVDPPIERIIYGGTCNWSTGGGQIRGYDTRKNGNGPGGLFTSGSEVFQTATSDPAFGNRGTVTSGVTPVVAGDFFTVNIFQDSGVPDTFNRGATWVLVVK